MQHIHDETAETVPLSVWSWLWALLAEELGPARAAEIYNDLCDRRSVLCQPIKLVNRMRQLGEYAQPDEA